MRKIRQELKKAYGYDTAHHISLKLIDYKSMTKLRDCYTVGLMKYNLERNETGKKNKDSKKAPKWRMKCEIYLLDTLTIERAGQVLAHELTHDYLFHHLGRTNNQAVCEGICEAIAAEWLLSQGKVADYEAKKQNPDPIYGEGFRLIYPQLKRRGFKKMLEENRHYFKPVIR